MPDQQLFVSVNIPVFNDNANLARLLDSLKEQSFKNFEINVIEGGDTSQTRELLGKYNQTLHIHIHKQELSGLVEARNKACKVSKGNVLVFVDADVKPNENWLEEIVFPFKISERIGGVGGPSIMPEELLANRDLTNYLLKDRQISVLKAIIRRIYFKIFLENKPFRINKLCSSGALTIGSMTPEVIEKITFPVKVDFLDASNMAFRSEIIKKTGGFDDVFEELAEYSEPELCMRINEKGYSLVFNPKAVVYHYPCDAKLHSSSRHAYARGKNFAVFVRKNPNCKLALCLVLYVSFFNVYHLFKGLNEKDPRWFNCVIGFADGLRKNHTKKHPHKFNGRKGAMTSVG